MLFLFSLICWFFVLICCRFLITCMQLLSDTTIIPLLSPLIQALARDVEQLRLSLVNPRSEVKTEDAIEKLKPLIRDAERFVLRPYRVLSRADRILRALVRMRALEQEAQWYKMNI